MVHYCFNTKLFSVRKCLIYSGRTQWLCLCHWRCSIPVQMQTQLGSPPASFPSALVELQAGRGTGWMHTSMLGSCGAASSPYWKGALLSLAKPLLKASHTEEMRLGSTSRSPLSWIIKTKNIFLYEVEWKMGCTFPFLVWRTLNFLSCRAFSFLFIPFCSWMKN